jgi:hypothetical protein
MLRFLLFNFVVSIFLSSNSLKAGLLMYSGPNETGHAIDPAIPTNDPRFVGWATSIDATRTALAPRGSSVIDQNGDFNSLGDLGATQIAMGFAPGFLTVRFDQNISNGNGADFVVFENGGVFLPAPLLFAELAFVEVSSNGSDFARFPSISLNTESDLAVDFGRDFASLDTRNVFNLAGKHQNGFGTPFDLDSLLIDPLVSNGLVDLNQIQFVKLVDIPGNGAFLDSQGTPVLDAWLTTGSGGFDFRLGMGLGVGVFNTSSVPEPNSLLLVSLIGTTFGMGTRSRSMRRSG